MAELVVDAMGQQCPVPVVMATKALKEVKEAGTVAVHVDNEVAVQNLLRLANSQKLEVKSEAVEENHYVVTMAVNAPLAVENAPEPTCCVPAADGSVVVVGAATMGEGSEELGKTLIKGFLYAVTQLENLPKAILFYNGGVALTCEGSASLEDLKQMEAQGVAIKSCGTCLDFYGLKEKLAVGTVTNMYDIVETMDKAVRVIKP